MKFILKPITPKSFLIKPVKQLLFLTVLSMFYMNTAFAEIVINGEKVIQVSTETLYKIDDDVVSATEFEIESEGHVATVIVDNNSASASQVSVNNSIKGPVTNLVPLQVLGQTIVLDEATILQDNNGVFALGDLLEVSGYFNTSNIVLATRIEKKSVLSKWRLTAHVEQIDGDDIIIGAVVFDISSVFLENCDSGVQVGALVDIKMPAILNFSTLISITDMTQFKCKNSVIDLPDESGDLSNEVEFEVEGFVGIVNDENNFEVNGIQVKLSDSTLYFNGNKNDIFEGVKLEAEGTLDTFDNILNAEKIKFKNAKVRIEGPVSMGDLTSESITIMGVKGLLTAFTEDKDNLIFSGITSALNIEARGFVDSSGDFIVEKFRERGEADPMDIRIRGPISNLNQALFDILSIHVDTTQSSYFLEEQTVDFETFMASLANGVIVDINHGQFDAQNNNITGGEATIELTAIIDVDGTIANRIFGKVAATSISYGTVTAFVPSAPPADPVNPVIPAPKTSSGGGSVNLYYMLLLTIRFFRRKRLKNY